MRAAPLVAGLLLVAALAVPAAAHLDHVTATPQASPDGVVYVGTVSVVEESFLVLRDASGRPVGATAVDPDDGTLHDVAVQIGADTWANTTGARTLSVDLYLDDGDGEFDPDADTPLSRKGLFTAQSVTVERGPRAYVGAGGERSQPTAGTVEVRRVVLPAAGHLVLQRSPDDPGSAVGHATLTPGVHAGVSVRLNRTFLASRSASFRLWATLYADDGDGEFDGDDRLVRAGDQRVQSPLRLTPEASTVSLTSTPTPDAGVSVVTATTGGDRRTVSPVAVAALLCSLLLGAYFLWQ